jgi:hypothetical protein
VQVIDQRHRTMLRQGNFWEAARGMARQGFQAILGAPTASPPGPPRLRVTGTWRQRRQMRAQFKRLWRLAYGTAPKKITAEKLTQLQAEMDAVKNAVESGSLRLESRGDSVTG